MALPWPLLSLLLFMVMPVPGSCVTIARTGSLIQCYDEPEPEPALTGATNGTAFRARLHRLLRALPSAAAPTGFASLNSTGRDCAYVRGLCFDDATPVPSSKQCLRCLTVAARNLTSGCGTTTRRAGIWTDGCSVAFADSDAFSLSEYKFRSRVLLGGHVAVPVPDAGVIHYSDYLRTVHARVVAAAQLVAMDAAFNISGPRMLALAIADETSYLVWPLPMTVHVLGQCAMDLTEVECSICLFDSAQAVDWDLDAARGDGGVAAAVVGFGCYLRFQVSLSSPVPQNFNEMVAIFGGSVGALIIAVYLLVILKAWG